MKKRKPCVKSYAYTAMDITIIVNPKKTYARRAVISPTTLKAALLTVHIWKKRHSASSVRRTAMRQVDVKISAASCDGLAPGCSFMTRYQPFTICCYSFQAASGAGYDTYTIAFALYFSSTMMPAIPCLHYTFMYVPCPTHRADGISGFTPANSKVDPA